MDIEIIQENRDFIQVKYNNLLFTILEPDVVDDYDLQEDRFVYDSFLVEDLYGNFINWDENLPTDIGYDLKIYYLGI